MSWTASATTSGALAVSFPTSFLTTLYYWNPSVAEVTVNSNQFVNGASSTAASAFFYAYQPTASATATAAVNVLAIGV